MHVHVPEISKKIIAITIFHFYLGAVSIHVYGLVEVTGISLWFMSDVSHVHLFFK